LCRSASFYPFETIITMTDDELHQRMSRSRLPIDFPVDFQREIWGRIEAAECSGLADRASVLWAGLLGWIARPVPAVALAVLMGVTGGLLAMAVGYRSERPVAEMVYLKSVSPFAAAKLNASR
jgi:hypothetical protein